MSFYLSKSFYYYCVVIVLGLFCHSTLANSCASADSTITIISNGGQCLPKSDDAITVSQDVTLSYRENTLFLNSRSANIKNVELINKGSIETKLYGRAVYLYSKNGWKSHVKNLTNEATGKIKSNKSDAVSNYASIIDEIDNEGKIYSNENNTIVNRGKGDIGKIINKGQISSGGNSAIYNNNSNIDIINNSGVIKAYGTRNSSYGIRNDKKSTINTIDNRGGIAAQDRHAVANLSGSRINIIKNQGDMVAKRQTIANYASIGEINNKGLVKANQNNAIFNTKRISKIINHRDAIISARSNAIFSAGKIDNITNYGSINTDKHTIINLGVVNEIDNGGKISSDGVIAIYNRKEISKIVNNDKGVISAGNYTLINRGKINTFENKGVLKTKLGANSAVAIRSNYNNSVLTTLNNYNLIDGKIETKGTELNLYGKKARLTGDVSNTGGSVNIKSGAQFTSEASFDSQSFTIENNAVLQLGDSSHQFTVRGASANAFNHSGTLVLSGNQTANITGNYTQSGTLNIQAASDSHYGKVSVTGNAVLTETAKFDVDVNAVNTLAAGQTLYGVVQATGAFSNKAPKTNVKDNSYLFDFESITNTNGQQVDLRILAASKPTKPEKSIAIAAQQECLRDGLPTARFLDKYVRSGQTHTDWDNVVSALGKLPNKESVAKALGQTMPLLHGNLASAISEKNRQTRNLLDAKSLKHKNHWVWVGPTVNHIKQSDINCYSGYQSSSTGLSLGMDFLPESSRHNVGIGVSYAKSNINGKSFSQTHSAKSSDLQLSLYGEYDLKNNRLLSWYTDYTHHKIDTQRGLPFINRVATGKTTGQTIRLGVELSQALTVPKSKTVIKPLIGFDFRKTNISAFSENGAGLLSYRYDKQKRQEAVIKAGIKVQHAINPDTQLLANATIGYDSLGEQNQVNALFSRR